MFPVPAGIWIKACVSLSKKLCIYWQLLCLTALKAEHLERQHLFNKKPFMQRPFYPVRPFTINY